MSVGKISLRRKPKCRKPSREEEAPKTHCSHTHFHSPPPLCKAATSSAPHCKSGPGAPAFACPQPQSRKPRTPQNSRLGVWFEPAVPAKCPVSLPTVNHYFTFEACPPPNRSVFSLPQTIDVTKICFNDPFLECPPTLASRLSLCLRRRWYM